MGLGNIGFVVVAFASIEINLILFLTFFLPSVGRLADLLHRCPLRLR